MMVALVIVVIVMLYKMGGFNDAMKYIKNSDESRNNIVFYQKDIENIINTIDNNGIKNAQNEINNIKKELLNTKDMQISNGKISISIQEFIQSMDEAINLNNKDTINNLLNLLKEQKITQNRLSLFDGVSIIGIIFAFAWRLGYFRQPHMLVRFMSICSLKDVPTATVVAISWMFISLVATCMMGMLGIAYINKFDLNLQDPEKIFIVISQLLFNPWIAAIISTASSQLLVSSSTIAENFYKKVFKKDASEKQVIVLGRIGVLLVSIIAFVISFDKNSSILNIVSYAWAGFGASFGSVIVFSLFWRRMTRLGAIFGMITGAVIVVAWKNYLAQALNLPLYEIVPGFLTASIVIILVSLTQPVREGTKIAFDTMMQNIR